MLLHRTPNMPAKCFLWHVCQFHVYATLCLDVKTILGCAHPLSQYIECASQIAYDVASISGFFTLIWNSAAQMAKRRHQRIDPAILAEALRVCACTNFRKAARVVTRLFDETLEPCGLRGTQLALLLEISLEDKTTVPRLARSLVTEESTVARNIQPLIRRGLIRAHRKPGQRTQALTLTPQGWAALERAVPFWKSAQTAFENLIGSKQWPRLLANLAHVAQGKL